jgi:hypothetical protein
MWIIAYVFRKGFREPGNKGVIFTLEKKYKNYKLLNIKYL